ncbi:MAG: MFS transporter [Burkholderiaceae bacterium]|nr:MFS transporter [Burkholderiaceae bacterium]
MSGSISPQRRHAQLVLVLAALVAAAMSYGVTLPLMPFMLERMLGATNADAVSWHTGMLTGLYTFALFFLSPLWGALADRRGARPVLVIGLLGAGASLFLLDIAANPSSLYLARGFSGVLSAAILPAGLGYVAETTAAPQRTRNFSIAAAATTIGFLLGPLVGSALASMVTVPIDSMRIAGAFMPDSPFFATGLLCVAIGLGCVALRHPRAVSQTDAMPSRGGADLRSIGAYLLLTALVVYGISAAEVGVTLLGKLRSVGTEGISRLFVVCGAVMIVVQVLGLPKRVRRFDDRRVLAIALLGSALAVALLPWARGLATMSLAFVALGAGIGLLIPVLATLISDAAGADQGKAMGWQAAAANLGQATAATATGGLFTAAPPLPFVAAAALLAAGAAAAALLGRIASVSRAPDGCKH